MHCADMCVCTSNAPSIMETSNHRACPDISYIPKVASGISTSTELQDAQSSTKTLKTRLDSLKQTRQDNLEEIRTHRNEALERATMYKDELIERIEELGKKTTDEIMDKYTQLEEAINGDLDELSKLIEALEDMDSKLKRFSDDETKLFVHLKMCKQYISSGEELEKTCSPAFGPDILTFDPNISIATYWRGITALSHFVEDTHYLDAHLYDENVMAVHQSDENIRSSADSNTCRITGMCSLYYGGLMLADYGNKCLKKLNKSFQIEEQCGLSSTPWDVCQTSPTEVAVTMLKDKRIQFVSVGQTLSLTRSFTLSGDDECSGISFFHGKLYVSRPNGSVHCLQVYDINGTLLQTIQKDKTGAAIFDLPLNIAVSACTPNIYVTDYNKGLIIMTKSGQLVATITDPDLSGAHWVCVLPGDQVLVCDRESHTITQFDAQGQNVRTLLAAADGMKFLETLHIDPDRSQLIVGMSSDTIKVYNLVKK